MLSVESVLPVVSIMSPMSGLLPMSVLSALYVMPALYFCMLCWLRLFGSLCSGCSGDAVGFHRSVAIGRFSRVCVSSDLSFHHGQSHLFCRLCQLYVRSVVTGRFCLRCPFGCHQPVLTVLYSVGRNCRFYVRSVGIGRFCLVCIL